MEENRGLKFVAKLVSYIVVAAIAAGLAVFFYYGEPKEPTKLDEIYALLEEKYIGELDRGLLEDAAAAAMVDALPDEWSYYVSLAEYESYKSNKDNSYVGIGITIQVREDNEGFDVLLVEPGSPALEAGIQPGDILVQADGMSCSEMGLDGSRDVIRGEPGTYVRIGVMRDGQLLELDVERRLIQVQVVSAQMLEGGIGLITIANFNDRCSDEAIAAIESLMAEGAQMLIFDVRYNPGGYLHELVKLLDYLLPEGVLFRSVDYTGKEEIESSDASCLEVPMAVLVNRDSYSASEFFAAALHEYRWATIVGTQTYGKGYYQNSYELEDGSIVNLSVGKYFTPNGICLADVGGLTPDVVVEVDEEQDALIYSGLLDPMEDPQMLAAIEALQQP